ncbi:MAG: exodeoxyribonuclease III [Candidatus Nanopelagicales bacterium]|nr:exodeoxyribonuclease III [Candidatus Nanopelagicales bacterium]
MLRVLTVNVNGIRATARRGGLEWLGAADADVICLQEVRATHEQLHEVLHDSPLAHYFVAHSPAPQLGRAGVAVLTREPHKAVSTKDSRLDAQGRWIEVEIDTAVGPITVASVYVNAGEVGTVRQDEKYVFLEAMDARLATLQSPRRKRPAVICGDFNVAHREVDIKNWKGNLKNSGFLPEERVYLDRWFDSAWIDLGRALGGPGPGPYTWWSWRGKGFDTDGGWRIDYVITTAKLAARAHTATVGKAATYAERWSDHAPLMVDFT